MHLKLVVNSFPTASETFLFNLVTGLEARGVTVTVMATSTRANPELYQARLHEWSGRLELVPLAGGLLGRARSTWSAMVRDPQLANDAVRRYGLRRSSNALLRAHHLMRGDPDIIHFAYSGVANEFLDALDLIPELRAKVFVSCRGSAEKVKPVTVPQRAADLERLFARVDRVHCVSEDMLAGLLCYGLRRDQAFVNFPSIDVAAFQRPTPYDRGQKAVWQLASTGRLHFQKGYVFALLALRSLKAKGIGFHYHVLGDGPDREMLTYVIRELELQDHVTLHGRVGATDVRRVLATTDIFILSSLYEGIANAVLEAMAFAIPIVTTTAGGMNEVIDHGVNGMIMDRFDPDPLARAIEELMQSGEVRGKIGERGRETVERVFVLGKQLDKFLDEYQRAIG